MAAAENLEEFRKLGHINSFQEPSYMATLDSFQDHLEEFTKVGANWLLLGPLPILQKLTSFKTIQRETGN